MKKNVSIRLKHSNHSTYSTSTMQISSINSEYYRTLFLSLSRQERPAEKSSFKIYFASFTRRRALSCLTRTNQTTCISLHSHIHPQATPLSAILPQPSHLIFCHFPTYPLATQSPAIQPPATQPLITWPQATQSPAIQPAAIRPPAPATRLAAISLIATHHRQAADGHKEAGSREPTGIQQSLEKKQTVKETLKQICVLAACLEDGACLATELSPRLRTCPGRILRVVHGQ
jgi:hypothetical protein